MGEGLPLAGKRVVVTRAAEQSAELTARLQEYGAEVIHLPAIAFAPPDDTAPLDAAIERLASFDWLLFTSQNAVRFFTGRCAELRSGWKAEVARLRVAAVGPATQEAAQQAGWKVDFVASRFHGVALAEEMGDRLRGQQILLPRSDRASAELPEQLMRIGAAVTEVVAYRTEPVVAGQPGAVAEQIRSADVVTLASPSAFHALAEAVGLDALHEVSRRVALAAIGPVTAAAIREAGLPVTIAAAEHTAAGLADSIAGHFRRQGVSSGAMR
jgi:uroporphyrinogen-III synthase